MDAVRLVLTKLDELTAKVNTMSEDVEDICADMFESENSENLDLTGNRENPDGQDGPDSLDLSSLQKSILRR